jgi:nucleotide-binding universal stress UspA family protein
MTNSGIGAASQANAKDAYAVAAGQPSRLVVCAETEASATRIIMHAKPIAAALGAELTLVHVMEAHNIQFLPIDPIEWELCRREAEAFVDSLSEEHASKDFLISTKVMQGRTSDQIANCVTNNLVDIIALCRSDIDTPGKIGQNARRIIEATGTSVLMIPANSNHTEDTIYRKILIPLDGSARAEAALPVARKIALYQGAEIVLAHAVPEPYLIQIGPLENEDLNLCNTLQRRNERVAHDYLARQCEQLRLCGANVRSLVLVNGDARRQLSQAIASEAADLVIISSHGTGGHADACAGDTANFLLANSTAPVLMVRRSPRSSNSHVHDANKSSGVRQPTGAS